MQKSHIQNYSVCPFCELVDDSADVIMIHVNEVHLDYLSPQAETIDDSEISEYGLEKQKRDSGSLLSNLGCSAVKKASSEETKNLDLAPQAMSVDVDLTCNAVGEGAVRRRPPKGNKGSSPSRSKNRRSYGGSPSEGVKRLIRSESNSPCHGFSRDDQEPCEVDPNSNYSQSCHSSPSRSQLSLELPYNEQGNPAKRRELFASYRSNSTPHSISGDCKTRSTPPVAKAEDITPVNEVVTQCPICGFFEADPNTLEKHINSAHFDVSTPSEVSVSGGAIASAPADLKCPLCSAAFSDPPDLELHVNVMHRDILSPATPINVGTQANSSAAFDLVCPVCGRKDGFSSTESLSAHIDSHFNKTTNHIKENLSPSAVKAMERERIYNQNKEQKEFNKLQAQYGMDNRGSYKEQYVTNMEKSLSRGEMSVVDYHEKRIMINRTQRTGLDDGCTKTKALCRRISLLSNRSREIASVHLCTTVDHYSGTAGDRGWGCGYRNIQMLLSSLQHHTGYYERLSLRGQDAIPSIEEIQRLIERAWVAGFDRMGAQQLGGKLLKTRKWIGATEVSALMAHSRIKCELLDFHKPSSIDGTHPEMFKWCLKYFSTKRDFTPPLYLQHQGHSRTIIGVEVLRYGEVTKNIQLLVLDPSTPPMQMARIFKDSGGTYPEDNLNNRVTGLPPTSPRKQVGYTCSGQKVVTLQDRTNKQKSGGYYNKQDDIGYGASALRLIRKPLRALRAKQYQLVAVTGLLNTEEERELSKVLVSTRIPKS